MTDLLNYYCRTIAAELEAALQIFNSIAELEAKSQNLFDCLNQLEVNSQRESHYIEQTLGKALGYPLLGVRTLPDGSQECCDPSMPGATTDGTVCVGDNVPASLATEAARRISKLEEFKLLVHSRLDAMEVPRYGMEKCYRCGGAAAPVALCQHCNGTGQRLVACRITARLDWVAEIVAAWNTISQDAQEAAKEWVLTEANRLRAKP